MWTMLTVFAHLKREEVDLLVDAPALITILVGAADGKIDAEERAWSEKVLQARTYDKKNALYDYYQVVNEGFWGKVVALQADLPADTDTRNRAISLRLQGLNAVLAQLELPLAAELYHGFTRLAHETAHASGGFLRLGAVSAAEAAWIDLPMLTPIHYQAPADKDDIADEGKDDFWEDDKAKS